MKNSLFVNICMVTFNRLEFTTQAIDSIVAHTKYPYVLTIVDNNSSDGTQKYLSSLQEKGIIKNLILSEKNNGIAKGSNMAWHCEPDAPYYLKFDNDMVVQKDNWLKGMIDVIDTIPILGVLGYNVESVSYPVSEINGLSLRLKRENIGGACFLIPKRTERLLGRWSERYCLYGEEDADYCERVRLLGLLHGYMEDESMMFHLPAGKAARVDPEDLIARDGKEEVEHAEYREYKDTMRYKVIKEEKRLETNCEAYSRFQKPLYESKEEPQWTEEARSTLMDWVFKHNVALLDKKREHSKQLEEDGIMLLADLYVKNPDYDRGRIWVDKAAVILRNKEEKTDAEAYKLASFLKLLGQDEEAQVWFEVVVNQGDDIRLQGAACFHVGEMHYANGRYTEASEALKQCVLINSDHRKAREYLADIEAKVHITT